MFLDASNEQRHSNFDSLIYYTSNGQNQSLSKVSLITQVKDIVDSVSCTIYSQTLVF